MLIIQLTIIFLLHTKTSSADSWFIDKLNSIIGRQIKDKNLKGSISKTVLNIGSVAKISCFEKIDPTQNFRHLSWYHSGKQLSSNNHYKINEHGLLTINGVTVEDAGEFVCQIISKSGIFRFKHDVNLIQFPSRSLHVHFVYAVRKCSPKSESFAAHFIESKVNRKVCLQNECEIGYIHSVCYVEEFANPRIKVTVPIVLPGIPNESCNTQCLLDRQSSLKERVKQKVISAVMLGSRLKIREEPREISISYLETEEDKICDPGFEMKGSLSKSLCFPCTPGHFLEKGYCIPCHLNQYNGKYAATECQACFGSRVTRSRGAINEDECYMADPDILWICFAIFLFLITLILFCCCWSLLKYLRRSVIFSDEKNKKNSNLASKSSEKANTLHKNTNKLKRSLDEMPINKKRPAPEPTTVIPSVRHSTGKDLYKPLRPVRKGYIPSPSALPTPNQSKRKMAYHTVSSVDNLDKKRAEQIDRITANRYAANKNTNLSLKGRKDSIPQYRERIKKNKAMYTAYMKDKV